MRGKQAGLGLMMLIVVGALLALVAIVAMKVVPDVTEYFAIKKAVKQAAASASTVTEIQRAFDRQASVGYISTLKGSDLDITKEGDKVVINFFYEKKTPLFGPTYLVVEYQGSSR
jgi:hypothetical protein